MSQNTTIHASEGKTSTSRGPVKGIRLDDQTMAVAVMPAENMSSKFKPVWAKVAVIAIAPCFLGYLLATNKSGSDCWLQVFNCVGAPTALDDVTLTAGVFNAAAHGLLTGQKVTTSTWTFFTNSSFYVHVLDVDTYSLHTTFAEALAGTNPLGMAIAADSGQVQGVVDGEPEELPLPANGAANLTRMGFDQGIYARAVTAAAGSTAISGNDVKFSAGYQLLG